MPSFKKEMAISEGDGNIHMIVGEKVTDNYILNGVRGAPAAVCDGPVLQSRRGLEHAGFGHDL